MPPINNPNKLAETIVIGAGLQPHNMLAKNQTTSRPILPELPINVLVERKKEGDLRLVLPKTTHNIAQVAVTSPKGEDVDFFEIPLSTTNETVVPYHSEEAQKEDWYFLSIKIGEQVITEKVMN